MGVAPCPRPRNDGLARWSVPTSRKLLLPWVSLPLTALDWAIAWTRLPERVVTKFGPGGRPVRWAPRDQALTSDLLLVGGVLAFTTALVLVAWTMQPGKAGKAYLGMIVTNAIVFLATNGVLWLVHAP
jgi:hypothetical protein